MVLLLKSCFFIPTVKNIMSFKLWNIYVFPPQENGNQLLQYVCLENGDYISIDKKSIVELQNLRKYVLDLVNKNSNLVTSEK